MKVVDGKIVEATEKELFSYWLKREFDDIMSFPEFIEQMQSSNVVIVKGDNNENN